MFRLVVEQQRCDLQPEDTFAHQEKEIVRLLESSEISQASDALYLGKNSIIPFR